MFALRLLAAAVLVALPFWSEAAEVTYPPYPDVWGRELPVAGRGDPTVDTDIYPAPDGDMLAYESFLVGNGQAAKVVVRRLSFFSGRDVLATEAELHEQRGKWPGPMPRSRGVRLEFPDGYSLIGFGIPEYLRGKWTRCKDLPVYSGIKNFRFDLNKTFIRIFPTEMDIKTHGVGCDPDVQPTTFRTRVQFVYLSSNQDYTLPDGTFLTILDRDFLVRFDRQLHSPFIDKRPDLFALDFSQVEPILTEANRREKEEPGFNPLQFIHDRVTELVMAMAMPKPTPR